MLSCLNIFSIIFGTSRFIFLSTTGDLILPVCAASAILHLGVRGQTLLDGLVSARSVQRQQVQW